MNTDLNFIELEKRKIIVISSSGHNGLDWLHSLIDGHPNILIMPAFSFFRTYYLHIIKFIKYNKNNIDYEYLAIKISELFFFHSSYQNQRRKILNFEKDFIIFKKYLLKYLINFKKLNLIRNLFFSIHCSYAEIKKYSLKDIKIIAIQEHVNWHSVKYINEFEAKLVFIMRDPRAALSGAILRMKRGNKNNPIDTYALDHLLLYLTYFNYLYWIKNFKTKKNKFYLIKNEEMHKDLSLEMHKLSNWLGVKFNQSMLQQSFDNKLWFGESSYLEAVKDLQEPPPVNYYNTEEIEKRWRKNLSPKEIKIIEMIFFKIMKEFKYSADNNYNFISYLQSVLKILDFKNSIINSKFNYLYVEKKIKFKKRNSLLIPLRVFYYLIRRLFVLYFPNLTESIFKIK